MEENDKTAIEDGPFDENPVPDGIGIENGPVEEHEVDDGAESPQEGTETVEGTDSTPVSAKKSILKSKTARAGACAVLAALLVAGGCYAAAQAGRTEQGAGSEAIEEAPAAEEGEPGVTSIALSYTAEGLKDDSTPVIVHIAGTAYAQDGEDGAEGEGSGKDDPSDETTEVDFYHAFSASEVAAGTAAVEVAEGDYKVEVLPSLNADGSMNSGTEEPVPAERADGGAEEEQEGASSDNDGSDEEESGEAAGEDVDGEKGDDSEKSGAGSEGKVEVSGETVKAEDVTKEQVQEVLDKVGEAAERGDETLKGDAGSAVVDGYKQAAEANPNTNKEEVEQKAEETKSSTEGEAAQTPASKQDKASGSQSSASSSNSSSTSTTSSASSSNSSLSKGHTHTVATRWVETQAAYDEPVYTTEDVYEQQPVYGTVEYEHCNLCEQDLDGGIWEHSVANHDGRVSYKSTYKSVITGYQNVKTGTRQVQTGTRHHDAQGYNQSYCTTCGATL